MKQQFIFLPLIILLLIGAGYLVFKTNIEVAKKIPELQTAQFSNPNPTQVPNLNSIYKTDVVPLGNPEAPIKIVEYGDYLCIYCAMTVKEFYPKIENLIKEGKVVLYFKDLISHREAVPIANAARCANEQNKFWEFNKAVFQIVLDISDGKETKDPTSKETWLYLAKDFGLNIDQFKKCIDENRYLKQIQQDSQEAQNLGFTGTPSFIINNEKISGLDLNKLDQTLNKFLNQK
jgi:protein-disulfide isomerase